MGQKEPEISLAGVVLWFGLLWVAHRYFPAGWQAPWSFLGWFSFLISSAFWIVSVIISLVVVIECINKFSFIAMTSDTWSAITVCGLVCFALSGFLHFLNSGEAPPTAAAQVLATTTTEPSTAASELLDNEQSLRHSTAQLCTEQEKLCSFITEMERERALVVGRLRQVGVSSNKDLEGNAEGKVYAQELLEIERTLRATQEKARVQSLTLTKADSLLRKIGRQNRMREVGLDSNTPQQFAQLRAEIDEMLQPDSTPSSNVLQLDQVLKEVLHNQR